MFTRIYGMVLRYLYLHRRSVPRIGEIVFWPVMDLMVWGFMTLYLEKVSAPSAVVFLIGSLIFWRVLYGSQQAVTVSFSEEIWVRNVINIFIAPISTAEFMAATCLVGIIKTLLTTILLAIVSYFFYAFDLFAVGPILIPYYASLVLFGWSVGMVTMALVLRYGQAAEALVWGVPFLIQPFSAVFYPVSVLPAWLQPLAWSLPSTYVFEGMRSALQTGRVDAGMLVRCLILNVVYLILCAAFFGWMFRRVAAKGYLSRIGME